MTPTVTWPNGLVDFYAALHSLAPLILGGTLAVIDPSIGSRDSQPGFAVFHQGRIQVSGTLEIPWRETSYRRLQLLYERVAVLLPAPPDVFAVEEIHKSICKVNLLWAVGVSIAAAQAPQTIEIPLSHWKALAKATPDYKKGDEADARMMGESLIAWCREHCAEGSAA
jgi:hypothetical protein